MAERLRQIAIACLGVALLAAPLRSQTPPKGYDQGLFEIRIPGNAAVTLPALVNPSGGVLLPVTAILKLTGLPEERSHGDSVRSIPEVGGGERRTVLDVTTREIRRSGQRIPIAAEEALMLAGELYLLTDRFGEFLQADVRFDWSTLIVIISRNPPFPAERNRDVESRRNAARESQGFGATLRPPDVGYRSRNGGYVLEWSASTSSYDVVRSFGAQTRLGLAVAGGDLSLGVIHSVTPTVDMGRWQGTSSYRRAFPNSRALRQVEAGDIVVGGATFQAVRGINFTNAAIVRDQFFSTLAVEPSVPLGWEYEVYQSGQLIGYSDAATRGAIGVPLRYGTTPVQVRLLSPSGEEVFTDMTFLVPPSLIQPGRLEYGIGAGKCSTLCDGFGYLDLKYGARQWLTLGGGGQQMWGTPGAELQPYGSINYAHFSGWQAELQGARSLFSRLNVSYYGLSPLNGSVTAGMNSPGVGQPSFLGAALRRWYAEQRLGYRLRVARPLVSSMRLESHLEGAQSAPTDHYRISAFADRQTGSLGLHYERDRADSVGVTTISALTILPGYGPRWLQHTGVTTSAGFRGGSFELFDMNSSIRLWRTTSLGLAARWNQRVRSTSASASLSSSLGFARSTSRVSAAPNRGSDATTTLSGVATFDPRMGVRGYEFGGIGSAGLMGVVFYDVDGDGRLGPADSVASGVGLVVGGQRQRTDARGRYRAWNIVPYELVEIAVDTLKGLSPDWIPLRVQQFTRATPHMYNRFDVPLAQTRELSGQVVADSGIWTSAGITVQFRNVETGQTATAVTFSDGAFYVSRMRPGQYEVTIAQAALDALGAIAVPDRAVLTIPLRGESPVIDMPPMHLAKPKVVEERVTVIAPPPVFTKRVITLKGVTFELNKAELTTPSYDVLDSIALALRENPGIRIEIAGHTDATGSRDRNMALSLARANAVREHFIFKGVDSARMIARGYGPDQPVATNRTSEGRALNRRTELRRLDEPGDSARVVADSLKALPTAEYTVQAGVFQSGPSAIRMRDRLVKAGFEARIVGEEAPFRVRVGRVATKREAAAILARLKLLGINGAVVRAELR